MRVGGLVRTTSDGQLDTNFFIGPALRGAWGAARQTDGKVLVSGFVVGDATPSGAIKYRVFRYLTNGTLDTAYNSPVFSSPSRFMTLQQDGKLLVPTDVTFLSDLQLSGSVTNGGIIGLARLNTDGSLDSGFPMPNFGATLIAVRAPPVVDTNGSIYIAGGFTQVNGQSRLNIARLHADGTLDSGFVPAGFTSIGYVTAALLQPGGKTIIAGRMRVNGDTTHTDHPLMRLNTDGSLDNSFVLVASSSVNYYPRPYFMEATSDGKILTVGTSMARFNSDGSLDSTFTRLPFTDSTGSAKNCYSFEQLSDGRIVVPADPRFGLGPTTINGQAFNGSVRVLGVGTLDSTFSPPIFQSDTFPTTVVMESAGRVLVAGSFDHVDSHPTTNLVRINMNGTLDTSYTMAVPNVVSVLGLAGLPGDQAYALLQAGDTSYGLYSNVLVRLQADGTVDAGFNPGLGSLVAQGYLFTDLLLQNTQAVLACSPSPQALIDQTNNPVVRLLSDGSPDASFQPAIKVPGSGVLFDGTPITNWSQVTINNIGTLYVGDLQVLTTTPDGKLIAGICTSTSTVSYTYQLIRLNGNGSNDASFSGAVISPAGSFSAGPVIQFPSGGGPGQVQAVFPLRCITSALVQSNGLLLVAGTFTNVNGTFRPGIARFQPDGTFDPTFPLGSGPALAGPGSLRISSLSMDSAGRIWVTGNFSQWDNISAPGYVRLNLDGSVDNTCVLQSRYYGLEQYDTTIFNGATPATAGGCFIFGSHFLAGDLWPRALTHVVDYPPPPLSPIGYSPKNGFQMTLDTLSGVAYRLEGSADLSTWQELSLFQGTGQPMSLGDFYATNFLHRFYRARYP